MITKILKLEDYKKTGTISSADLEKIREAAAVLRNGGLVAFPTETVYGLGGDARRADVSARIYAAKGRPSDNPLIAHISCMEELQPLVTEIPETCRKLADAYWPGPMTLVMNKSAVIPKETTGGLDTVAVRMPVHPVANRLIELAGVPVAAPSANRSGRPSTTTAEHCVEDLDGRIDLILDGGPCDIGVESTIVDLTEAEPVLLRPGAVTMEMLTKTLGREPAKDKALLRALSAGEKPKAPGMKYRHYAPRAPLVVVRLKQPEKPAVEPGQPEKPAGEPKQPGKPAGEPGQPGKPPGEPGQPGKPPVEPKQPGKPAGTVPCLQEPQVLQEGLSCRRKDITAVYARILELAEENLKENLRTEIICTEECAAWLRKQAETGTGGALPSIPAAIPAAEIPAAASSIPADISAAELLQNIPLRILGSAADSRKISRNLFAVLRDTDEDRVDRLIAEGFGESDLFLAIMNRLKKAAGWQIEEV